MTTLSLFLAALIGLSLGLLGGGGSILAVPIFVYVLDFGAKEAIASSLAVVGLTSLSGAVGHWRAGNVNLRVALLFGAVAVAGTYLGARLAVFFSGAAQLLLFGGVMLAAAFFMYRDKEPDDGKNGGSETGEGTPSGIKAYGLIVAEGLTVGVLTGLVGVGGGFLIVPALVLIGKMPMKTAVGTSLLVISMKGVSGVVGYLGQVEFQWTFLALFSAVAIAGSFAGAYLARFVPQDTLKKVFAGFLIVMGIFIVYQNKGAVPFL